MVIIFSKTEIEGLAGTYATPLLFDGKFGGATLVITKHEHIKAEALEQGIKVRGFEGTAIEAPKETLQEPLQPLTLIEEPIVEEPKKRKRTPKVDKKAE